MKRDPLPRMADTSASDTTTIVGVDTATASATGRPRVVIVGGGFGGLSAARALGNRDVDVLVLSRTSYHGFWMMLYQVAAAQLEPESIATPVRAMLRRFHNTRFRIAEVRGVDLERKLVLTEDEEIPYDYLILAAGSTTNYFGNDRFSARTLGLHDVAEAEQLRDQVLAAFERAAGEPDPEKRAALMSIAIIGGGPTGVELAGAFAELIDRAFRKDYPELDTSMARVVLVESNKRLLGTFPARLQRSALRKLERLGVKVRLGVAVADIVGDTVVLADGDRIAAHTVVWSAGVRGAPLADGLGVALGRGARVRVTPALNLPERPEVFVIGDMAYLENERGEPYPMVAQVALQMGKRAGRNVLALAGGRETREFHYFDIGQMAMVGRGAALFDSFGVHLAGVLGWLIWLFIHLVNLPGMRNRLAVATSWIYTIVSGDPGVRAATAERAEARVPAPALAMTVGKPVLKPVAALPSRGESARERKRAA